MTTPDLFSMPAPNMPLAARMRPTNLEEYVGQAHLLAAGKPLYQAIKEDHLHSMIFWGPPGTGKTSLAHTIAELTHAEFRPLSAVLCGVKDIRAVMDEARQLVALGKKTVLFVDEVHRFNKSQQDAFLPFIEDGTVIFIGATTENPAFELNNALLSRARVYIIKPLEQNDIVKLLTNAIAHDSQLSSLKLDISESLLNRIAGVADGDGRRALNLLEIAVDFAQPGEQGAVISEADLDYLLEHDTRRFSKGGDEFYDQISALHKSVRGSAADAALYWLMRMLDGGCEALYIARRLVRMASEDIGNADPRALRITLDAWDTLQRLGTAEGELALAQAVLYLACAPKSNAVYLAYKHARADVRDAADFAVPDKLRNAPTKLAKNLGHGEGYRYAHDEAEGYAAGENYFPDAKSPQRYYVPVERGLEVSIGKKLEYLRALDQKHKRGRN